MGRILIIEDQADLRSLIRWTLAPGGHEIHEATHGQRGLARPFRLPRRLRRKISA
jgi:CheY-like chemotaxis protein